MRFGVKRREKGSSEWKREREIAIVSHLITLCAGVWRGRKLPVEISWSRNETLPVLRVISKSLKWASIIRSDNFPFNIVMLESHDWLNGLCEVIHWWGFNGERVTPDLGNCGKMVETSAVLCLGYSSLTKRDVSIQPVVSDGNGFGYCGTIWKSMRSLTLPMRNTIIRLFQHHQNFSTLNFSLWGNCLARLFCKTQLVNAFVKTLQIIKLIDFKCDFQKVKNTLPVKSLE